MEALNVDEMVGQLLASEGFTSVEELAYVDAKSELASIEGFDEDTAAESRPAPANISRSSKPNRREAQGARRRRRCATSGHHLKMMVALGENDVKTSRILPAAPLTIWSAGPNARTASHQAPGILDASDLSREDAEP
jgi:N utilization substance protein A